MNTNNLKYSLILFVCSLFNTSALYGQNTNDSVINNLINNEKLNNSDSPLNNDNLVNIAFGTRRQEDLLGGVSFVNIAELMNKNYASYSLDNLQSFIGGYNGNIWGQEPLILVDGVPRLASDVRMTEVATITVLKGASAVVLYGSTAAKGVILITTKRGAIQPLSINVRANTGLYVPKSYPGYLNAADYMTLYNEASRNDGITEKYTQAQISNTRTGTNPYEYPDINFFSSDYLKKAYNKSDVTLEISGGDKKARYYTNVGVASNNSIMNYGNQKDNNDLAFNLRGNVDMNLSKWLSAAVNTAANISNSYTGRGDFWGTSTTLRPNWVSPLLPISMMDNSNSTINSLVANSNNIIDGQYLLGGTSSDQTNAFADMLAAGYIKTKNRKFMFDATVNADLNGILEGLSFKAGYSMDYTSVYSEAYQVAYAVYQPTWTNVNGKDVITSLAKYNNDGNSTNEFVGRTTYSQTTSFREQLNYDKTFSKHNITATALGWGYMTTSSSDANNSGSTYQPTRNTNLGLQAGYNYNKKYYLDFSSALVHSAKLSNSKNNAFSPSVTAGWSIGKEKLFKNNIRFVNDLKITASYATLNQDIDISDYYLYQGYYDNKGGWYQWRDGVAGGWTTGSRRGDNPNLTFIKRQEFRTGLQGALFNNLITFDANYFYQNTNGLLTQGSGTIYPSYFSSWDYSFLPYLNYNNDRRTGIDFSLNLNKRAGAFEYSIGFNGMFYNSKAVRRDEVYSNDYQYRAGRALDSYWGYISEGFFQNQSDIDNHAKQTWGTVQPGDIKYKDVNNDGIIDSKDQIDLGHNGWASSPFTYGINLTVKWKGFTLFALANGQSGAIGFKNSSYYWINGNDKYSDVVWNRWTEETKNTATYPRLTTTANANNYQNSTFWVYKNNRFNLTRVQLTYDFKPSMFKKGFVHGLSAYISCENLLVISKERKMMETNVGSAPQYRFYNLGIKANF